MGRSFNTPPLPLGTLTLHTLHHRAALWWLGWLYRNPGAFRASLKLLPRLPALRAAFTLYLHALPWMLVLTVLGKMLLSQPVMAHPEWARLAVLDRFVTASTEAAVGLGGGLVSGLIFGFIVGLVFGRAVGLSVGLGVGLLVGPFCGIVYGVVFGLGGDLISGLASSPIFSLAYGLVYGLVVGFSIGLGGGLGGSLRVGLVVGLLVGLSAGIGVGVRSDLVVGPSGSLVVGLGGLRNGLRAGVSGGLFYGLLAAIGSQAAYYRPYYLGAHALFWWLRRRPACYDFHPAAWDWLCWTPFPWFDRLLVCYAEADPARMEPEIQRLIQEVPGQKIAAVRALTILRARRAARVGNLKEVSQVLADLPEGERGFLSQTRRVRELAEPIVQQQMRVEATTRSYFREIETRSLIAEIRNFRGRITGLKEPITTEFRKAADAWLVLAKQQHEAAARAIQAEPAPQVFRAGDPVERKREAFVPRFRVLEELEGQVMLGSGCPGLLLRGPRRMGKSSLLRNVKGFLPKDVSVVVVSLQSAQVFSSVGHLVGGLSQAIADEVSALPGLAALKGSLRANAPADLAGGAGQISCQRAVVPREVEHKSLIQAMLTRARGR